MAEARAKKTKNASCRLRYQGIVHAFVSFEQYAERSKAQPRGFHAESAHFEEASHPAILLCCSEQKGWMVAYRTFRTVVATMRGFDNLHHHYNVCLAAKNFHSLGVQSCYTDGQ
jgi:hypothetical protein